MRLKTSIVGAMAAASLPVLLVFPAKADPGAANPQGKEVAPTPAKAGNGRLGYSNVSWTNYSTIAQGAILLYPSGNHPALGYQAKAGVTYQVSPKPHTFFEGTYQGSTFIGNSLNVSSMNAFGAPLGARYHFGGSI